MGKTKMMGIPMPVGKVQEIVAFNLRKNPSERRKYWMAHFADGSQLGEHDCRWADIPLHKVVMLELKVYGQKYLIEWSALPPTFVEFILFNTAVRKLRVPKGQPDEIESRVIGWTDGVMEHIIRVDEKTGEQIGFESNPVRIGHLHPQSRVKPLLEGR